MERVRWHLATLLAATHPRYLVSHALVRLLPPFGAGTLVARLYRWGGIRIGAGTAIAGPMRLVTGQPITDRLDIGCNVVIATDVVINLDGAVTIGDRCSIGPLVRIYTGTHGIGPGSRRMMPHVVGKPVTIEDGAWVGLNATVLPGVTVGRGAVVGAGSVVADDVPPHTYVEGNPAQAVRSLPWADR